MAFNIRASALFFQNAAPTTCQKLTQKLTLDLPLLLLKVTSHSLQLLANMLNCFPKQALNGKRVLFLDTAVNDSLYIIRLLKLPCTFDSLLRSIAKAEKYWIDYQFPANVDEPSSQRLLRLGTTLCKVSYKTMTLFHKVFFSSCAFYNKHFEAGETLKSILYAGKVFQCINSLFKIAYINGKLLQRREIVYHSIDLVIEGAQLIVRLLRLTHVRVHPAATLVIESFKCIFEVYYLIDEVAALASQPLDM